MTGEFTESERVQLLAREWEYRHRVFWASFNIWGFIVGAAILAPFVKPDLLNVGWPILIVPAYGAGIALFASYHLGAEARRMSFVFRAFASARNIGAWAHKTTEGRLKHRLHTLNSAKVIANLFSYVLVPACFSSALLIGVTLYDKIGSPFAVRSVADIIRGLIYLTAIFAPIVGFGLATQLTFRAERRKATVDKDAEITR